MKGKQSQTEYQKIWGWADTIVRNVKITSSQAFVFLPLLQEDTSDSTTQYW